MISWRIDVPDRHEGAEPPPWYYAKSWREWDRCVTVYHVFPMNVAARIARHVRMAWDGFRTTLPRKDREVYREIAEAYAAGFSVGLVVAMERHTCENTRGGEGYGTGVLKQ